MISFIASLLGKLIKFIYQLTNNNYGLSIIIFAIITKLILLPLNIKQVKSTEKINEIKPEYDKIMEKYKNNKEKQAEEITKLYADNHISPVGGCLIALIQIPIVLAMFYIVRQPLTYVINLSQEEISIYTAEILNKEDVGVLSEKETRNYELQIARKYELIDMNFLGINLGDSPSNVFNKDEENKVSVVTLIVPILSFAFSLLQIKLSKQNNVENQNQEQQEMQKSMNMMMPILSASISYTMPLALGIYWLLGSIFSILQQILMKKYILKDNNKKEEHLLLNEQEGGKK